MNSKYLRKENEEDLDYAMRLVDIKKNEKPDDLDWGDIVELLGLDLNKDSLRKSQDTIFGGISVYQQMKQKQISNESVDYQEEIATQIQELKKERIKLSDERAALNRRLRTEARKENIYDLAIQCAKENSSIEPIFNKYDKIESSNKVALLTLSDFHYGLQINEFNNSYNPEIFKERLNKLLNKTLEYMKINKTKIIYVLGLGDYLSGLIHTTIKIENREQIIEQIMQVSDYLYRFLSCLGQNAQVLYYDVNDNHGRINANKDDSLNRENFALLIKWYLEAKFKDDENVKILQNVYNNEFGVINIFGRNYGFAHGHRDKINEITQNLSLMTKKFFDAIFIGHGHHFEANEVHGTYIYMNGTFAGTDEYSNNIRKTSNPSQNLFILNPEEGIECQYLIKL